MGCHSFPAGLMLNPTNRFQWQSQSVFVIVAAGATLSLNDFLTFPILAGQNGGGAFLMLYVLFLLVMGLPLLMRALLIGRLGRLDPAGSFEILAQGNNTSVAWVIPRQVGYRRLGLGGRSWFEIWNYLIRYVTPVLLLVVALGAIGII